MRNMFQCEKCGKVFADYDECYVHENRHLSVANWYKLFESASESLIKYNEKQEAPSEVGVELMRYDFELNKEVHAVGRYVLKEVFMEDSLVSDEEMTKQKEQEEQEELERQEKSLM